MEEWKTYKLSEIAKLSTGFPFDGSKYSKEGIRVVRGDNVTIGALRWETDKDKRWNIPFDRANEYSLQDGDIVVGMDGSRVGRNRAQVQQSDLPLLIAQRVACIRNNELSHQQYLYYQIFCDRFCDYIKSVQTGTSIPHVSLKQIGDYEVVLPSLPYQIKVANVLSSLDSKIELNNRINHNLEEQAQALYKSWFVDFEPFKDGKFIESELGMIPEGWRVGTLSEVSSITMGQSPSGTSFNEAGNGIAFYQGRTEFGFRFPTTRLFTTEPARFAEQFSILLSVRAPVGDINIAKEKCCIGRGLASIHGKYQSFVFYTVESLKPVMNRFNGEGTVFGSINRKELEGLKIVVPPLTIQKEFNSITNIFDREIYNKSIESVTLCHLRDTLLPKLMSGELKINEIDC